MTNLALETCPGCQAQLPRSEGAVHRYIGASAACWELYSNLLNGGEPPLAPAPAVGLLVDAYAAQHPGTPSPQAVQSVAVHLLTLYGVLVRGMGHNQALWIRRRALREQGGTKHGRFHWLIPPSFAGSLTVADIVRGETAEARTELVERYVDEVWAKWAEPYERVVAEWYNRYVVGD